MIGTFVVAARESLEAALVITILLACLRRAGRSDQFRYVWIGVAAGLVACVGFAAITDYLESLFDGRGEQVFQAAIMTAAVLAVTTMVLWMHRHAATMRRTIEREAESILERGEVVSLVMLAAIAVFREGAEMILFLWGLALSSHPSHVAMLAGGLLGIGSAVGCAWLLYVGAVRLNLAIFFRVTEAVLILMAAGMLSQAANRLIGVGLLDPVIGQVWNTSWLLDERGPVGTIASILVGYRSRPSLVEAAVYFSYVAAVAILLRATRDEPRRAVSRQAAAVINQ
jgi:high-affinity iron transporter